MLAPSSAGSANEDKDGFRRAHPRPLEALLRMTLAGG